MSSREKHSQCFDAYASIDKVKSCIEDGHPVVVLMRGVPGSGKSSLARELLAVAEGRGVIHSTDDFFTDSQGNYKFNISMLDANHKKNTKAVRDAIDREVTPVIVDNTNLEKIHMKVYADYAARKFYEIYIVEPDTKWKYNVGLCAFKNIHGLGKAAIQQKMATLEAEGKPSLQSLVGDQRKVELTNFNVELEVAPTTSNPRKPCAPSTSSILSLKLSPTPSPSTSISPSSSVLFSMKPLDLPKIKVADAETNVTFVSLAYYYADMEWERDATANIMYEPEEINIPEKKVMKDRKTQVYGLDTESDYFKLPITKTEKEDYELSLLYSMFGTAHVREVRHMYQTLGLRDAFLVLKEAGWTVYEDAVPWPVIEDISSAISSKESTTTPLFEYDLSSMEQMVIRKAQEMDKNIKSVDYYNSYPTMANMDHDETLNDEEIARALALQEQGIQRGIFTRAQEEQLKKLQLLFPGVSRENIIEYYEDHHRKTEHTIGTLRFILGRGEEEFELPKLQTVFVPTPKPSTSGQTPARGSDTSRTETRYSVQRWDEEASERRLLAAQEEATRMRVEINKCLSDLNRHVNQINKYGGGPMSTHDAMMCTEAAKRRKTFEGQVDEIIRRGNTSSKKIDLHHMSANGALAFVKERLETSGNREILIITGSDNNSYTEGGKIRPKIVEYLKQNKVFKCTWMTSGSVLVSRWTRPGV